MATTRSLTALNPRSTSTPDLAAERKKLDEEKQKLLQQKTQHEASKKALEKTGGMQGWTNKHWWVVNRDGRDGHSGITNKPATAQEQDDIDKINKRLEQIDNRLKQLPMTAQVPAPADGGAPGTTTQPGLPPGQGGKDGYSASDAASGKPDVTGGPVAPPEIDFKGKPAMVQKNDNIYSFARRNYPNLSEKELTATVAAIYHWNKAGIGDDPNALNEGQKLELPPTKYVTKWQELADSDAVKIGGKHFEIEGQVPQSLTDIESHLYEMRSKMPITG